MKVYERLAQAFLAEGTSAVFGIMGDGNMWWMEALDKLGVQLLEVRHEGAGLGMADGWARAVHTPGVCTATCGPGVTQLATALVTANRAASGLVVFAGESPTNDDEYNQKYDQAAFAAACESGFVRLTHAEGTDEAVRKAFYLARLESRPIMLSAPMDVQQQSFDDDDAYRPSSSLLPAQSIQPGPEVIRRTADIVAGSERVVVIAGRGAIWSGAGDAILKLAERSGALLATTLQAKNWLNTADFHVGVCGLYSTRTAIELLQEADCVIALGASLNRYTTEHGYLFPNAKYVHVDIKPHVLMGGGQFADCYVQADARLGAEALERELAVRSVQRTGFRTAEVKARLANHFADPAEFPIEPDRVDPREVCLALDEAVPGHIQLVMGSGASAGFTTMLFNRPRPMVLGGHYFGCIGQMLPAAMGAVVASGYKPTMLLDGDASVMMHIGEFETAVRYNMPLLVVVLNDQALGSEYHKMRSTDHNFELATVGTPDLGAVGAAFGGRGKLATSVADVRAAAAEWLAQPGPMLVDARISRNVVTVPYRRLHYGRDE